MEINSVSNHYNGVSRNKAIPSHSFTVPIEESKKLFQNTKTVTINTRQNMQDIVDRGTDEQAANSLKSIQAYPMAGPLINLRDIMLATHDSSDNIISRISRISDQFNAEASSVHSKSKEIIRQGELEGKTPKEILQNIIDMYDDQSDLFKLSVSWEGKRLSDSDQYSKLIELTPGYFNAYA